MARVNGLDKTTLDEMMSELQKDPSLGPCEFRARTRWLGGTRSVSRVANYYAEKQEMEHSPPFDIEADEPPILAGGDESPSPVEYLLTALASCVTSAVVVHATTRGIEIRSLETHVDGQLDANGLSGLDENVPIGFKHIRVEMIVDADVESDHIREFAHFSPTLNTITRGAKVDIDVKKPMRRSTEESQSAYPI